MRATLASPSRRSLERRPARAGSADQPFRAVHDRDQSAHGECARCGRIDWRAIALLYEGLVRAAPTLSALVGRAAALAETSGRAAGFALLDDSTPERVKTYQPYLAVRTHLLRRLGHQTEALGAF